MKEIAQLTQDQFEDVHFSPDLVVVEKSKTYGKELHMTTLYVFEKVGDKDPIRVLHREITAQGTTYVEYAA
ncbi:hypothetical protein [Cronobacter phage vB_Cdu_VP8]|nr:putative suppressor tRNA modifier protein [Serratia phage SP1]WDS61552.1 hypothetical protein [Cronobacter phage vB_Cdu_VP8]